MAYESSERDTRMNNTELQAAIDNAAAKLKDFTSGEQVAHHALNSHFQRLLGEQRRRAGIIG